MSKILSIGCALALSLYGVAAEAPSGTARLLNPASDPLEGFNRGVQVFNKGANEYVAVPIGTVYRAAVPMVARKGIHNFFLNLKYPLHLVNNCLQGNWDGAWIETKRFGVNTTAGVLGFWDAASHWDMDSSREDFGQTMGYYGMGPGCYLNLPLLGPTTARDLPGAILGLPFDIGFWLAPEGAAPVVTGVSYGNTISNEAESWKVFFDSNYDSYILMRASVVLGREGLCKNWTPSPDKVSNPDQSLGALILEPKRETFRQWGYQRKVRLPGATRDIPFHCWVNRGKTSNHKVMVLLSGLGGYRTSNQLAGLAELYHDAGWTVLCFSSVMAPEVFLGFPDGRLPGDIRRDCADLGNAIALALDDVSRRFPEVKAGRRCSITGISLGASLSLFIAARQNDFQCDKVIAINPPRDPMASLKILDDYFAIPEKWGEDKEQRSTELVYQLSRQMQPFEKSKQLSLTLDESQFLIGLSMKLPLFYVLEANAKRAGAPLEGGVGTDPAATLAFSWNDYAEKVIVPQSAKLDGKQISVAELATANSLTSLDKTLSTDSRVFVFHNQNDFLLKDGDCDWFKKLMGERAVIMQQGSHCGTLHVPEVQQALLKTAEL